MSSKGNPRAAGRPRAGEGGLTRERVLEEALRLLDREGLRSLTMRRLSDHLGVTPMALYNHVESKQDLLLGVARTLFDSADFASASPDWRERIRASFREMRRVCRTHPEALRLIEVVDSPGDAVFVPMETTLAALNGLSISHENALRAYFLLVNFTLGQVNYEVHGPFKGVDLRAVRHHPDDFAARFPHVARVATLPDWDFDAAFEFGLSTIITGLETQADASTRRTPNSGS